MIEIVVDMTVGYQLWHSFPVSEEVLNHWKRNRERN